MEIEELRRRVSEIAWFHTIDLGRGVVTPGVDDTARKLRDIRLPGDLTGQTVLDVGAWDGFFSFAAEKRGARQVVAVDSYCWSGKGWGSKQGFDLAREMLGSRVQDRMIDVMDLSPRTVGVFDVVLFLGVLYHMRHPLLALEKVASVTTGCLILETEVDLVGLRRPAMAFYPGNELNKDPTNWWAPNPGGLLAMLQAAGFTEVEVVSPPKAPLFRAARALKQGLVQRKNPFHERHRDRMVIHARK